MTNFINQTRLFLLGVFHWICRVPGHLSGLFSQPDMPQEEFIRAALEQKSWFDTISSNWMEQSFLVKASVITGITLLSSLIGVAIGASLIFGLSALFVSIGTHLLLTSHESNRIKHATLFFETSVALNADLEANIQLSREVGLVIDKVADELKTHAAQIEITTETLENDTRVVQENNQELSLNVTEMLELTTVYVEKEKEVVEILEQTNQNLHVLDEVVVQATTHVENLSEVTVRLSDTASSLQETQMQYAELVTQLGFFVTNRMSQSVAPKPSIEPWVPREPAKPRAPIARLDLIARREPARREPIERVSEELPRHIVDIMAELEEYERLEKVGFSTIKV